MSNAEKITALAAEYDCAQIDIEPVKTVLGRTDFIGFKCRFPTRFHAEAFYKKMDDLNHSFIFKYGWEAIFVDGTFKEY